MRRKNPGTAFGYFLQKDQSKTHKRFSLANKIIFLYNIKLSLVESSPSIQAVKIMLMIPIENRVHIQTFLVCLFSVQVAHYRCNLSFSKMSFAQVRAEKC